MDGKTTTKYTGGSTDAIVRLVNISTNKTYVATPNSGGWFASGIGKKGNVLSVTITDKDNTRTMCGGRTPYTLK